ncbi:MAG: serine hydrolase domain-containing protein [Cyclobacteriaceae bacterium]
MKIRLLFVLLIILLVGYWQAPFKRKFYSYLHRSGIQKISHKTDFLDTLSQSVEVTQEIKDVLKKKRLLRRFEGAILIGKGNRVITEVYKGFADINKKDTIIPAHAYQLASVSKVFTAAAVLKLVEQKKINLTDNILQFLPELHYEGITVEHLLSHTSGLNEYIYIVDRYWPHTDIQCDNHAAMQLFAMKDLNPIFHPGKRFDYKNTNYMLLALIVERVAQMRFDDFLQQHFFGPLNLSSPRLYHSGISNLPANYLHATSSCGRRRCKYLETRFDGVVGDKGLYTNARDLYWLFHNYATGKLVADSLVQKAFTPFKDNRKRDLPYGYGMRIHANKKHKAVYHRGLWDGFKTGVKYFPDRDLTIIVLSHYYNSPAYSVMNALSHYCENKKL